MHTFPNLVHVITYGTPISNLPLLTHKFIPVNMRSADIDPTYMDNFIQKELYANHFDGPFTVQEAHYIFDGHFCTAPLSFIEKPGSTALRDHLPSLQQGCIWSVNEQLAGPFHGCYKILHSC